MRSWLRRAVGGVVTALLLLVAAGIAARAALARPLPTGVQGPDAEALADRVQDAIGQDAWAATGAVRFTIFGHAYLWDRERNLVRFEDGRGEVLTEGWRPMGRAFRDGQQVGGAWKDKRVQKAYADFVNDAFWAFAPTKLRDDGTSRALVGEDGLLVSYASGGVTPGDAYLWEVGPDGLPVAWRLWVHVLPVPGIRATWSDWTTLATGVKVARHRSFGPFGFEVTELAAAAHLSDLVPGEDPFAPMDGP